MYFKKAQRIYDPKFWQSDADAIVRYCLKGTSNHNFNIPKKQMQKFLMSDFSLNKNITFFYIFIDEFFGIIPYLLRTKA